MYVVGGLITEKSLMYQAGPGGKKDTAELWRNI